VKRRPLKERERERDNNESKRKRRGCAEGGVCVDVCMVVVAARGESNKKSEIRSEWRVGWGLEDVWMGE